MYHNFREKTVIHNILTMRTRLGTCRSKWDRPEASIADGTECGNSSGLGSIRIWSTSSERTRGSTLLIWWKISGSGMLKNKAPL